VSATTWASAPGYEAETSTVGGAISGYCATGSVHMAIPPATVMMIDNTEAKIGRWMKKRENTVRPQFGWPTINGLLLPAICGRADDGDSRPFTGVSALAVFGPAFTPGEAGGETHWRSGPFTGLLPGRRSRRRTPVNGRDRDKSEKKIEQSRQPGVNAGPNTGCAGKGRKRP